MTIEKIRENILADDAFVQTEIDRFVVWYNLKHTIRYDRSRAEIDETESVAEHVFGMHIICDYFLPLKEGLDSELVRHYINWHDMGEALVTDMMASEKTDEHRQAEKEAEEQIINTAPEHLKEKIGHVYKTFDSKETPEAIFVKALDKVEPLFYLYFLIKTKPDELYDLGWDSDGYKEYRRPNILTEPLLLRFDEVISKTLDKSKFFSENNL